MKIIDICDAKADLSEMDEQLANGEQYVIENKRLGFMGNNLHVPDDFDRIGAAEIKCLFDHTN